VSVSPDEFVPQKHKRPFHEKWTEGRNPKNLCKTHSCDARPAAAAAVGAVAALTASGRLKYSSGFRGAILLGNRCVGLIHLA